MCLNKLRETEKRFVDDIIPTLISHNEDAPENEACDKCRFWENFLTISGIIGPLGITVLFSIKPLNTEVLLCPRNIFDILCSVLVCFVIVFANYRSHLWGLVVQEIEKREKSKRQLNTEQYFKTTLLEAFREFSTYAFLFLMENKNPTHDECSKYAMAWLYSSLAKLFSGDYFIINIYEKKDQTIRMILTYTKEFRQDRTSIEAYLYTKREEGVSAQDETIQDLFCVQCINQNQKKYGDTVVLNNWKEVLKSFKCQWSTQEKQDIIQKDNRKVLLQGGFKYNQYFGAKFSPLLDTEAYIEIITLEDTKLTSKYTKDFSRGIVDYFVPIISDILWKMHFEEARK